MGNKQPKRRKFAKALTNTAKVVSVLFAGAINTDYYIRLREVMPWDEQKSLLLLCLFFVLIFLPVDLALLFTSLLGIRHKQRVFDYNSNMEVEHGFNGNGTAPGQD